MVIDLTLKIYKPKRELCVYCGERKAEVVIFNPNKFPNNDIKIDKWDVCKECRDIINKQMEISITALFDIEKAKEMLRNEGYKEVI